MATRTAPEFILNKLLNSSVFNALAGKKLYYIVSHPKSGRTWLKVVLGKAVSLHYGLDDTIFFKPYYFSRKIPQFRFVHGNFKMLLDDQDISSLSKKHIIHLVRDPRDVVVSYYFHITKRAKDIDFSGDLHDFIYSEEFGVRRIIQYLNMMRRVEENAGSFLEIRYEDLKNDFSNTFKTILDYTGLPLSEKIITESQNWGSIDNMKKLERADYFNSSVLKPKNADDPSTYKVRSGKIGGYREIVNGADQAYIDEIISRDLDDRYSQYKYTT
jgi:hypothetical protein